MRYLLALFLLGLSVPTAPTKTTHESITHYELSRLKKEYFMLGRLDYRYELLLTTEKAYPKDNAVLLARKEAYVNWSDWSDGLGYSNIKEYNAFYKDAMSLVYPGASEWNTPKKSENKSLKSED